MFRIPGGRRSECRHQAKSSIANLRRVDGNSRLATPTTPPAPTVTGLVNCDPVNPCSQIRIASEVPNALECSQECFLGQVACFFAVFSQTIEQPINLTGPFLHQLFKG